MVRAGKFENPEGASQSRNVAIVEDFPLMLHNGLLPLAGISRPTSGCGNRHAVIDIIVIEEFPRRPRSRW